MTLAAAPTPPFDLRNSISAWRDSIAAIRFAADEDTGRLAAIAAETADGRASLGMMAGLAIVITAWSGIRLEAPGDGETGPAAEAARLVDSFRCAARSERLHDVVAAVPEPRTAFALTALLTGSIVRQAPIPRAALDDIARDGSDYLLDVHLAVVEGARAGSSKGGD